jgi:AbiU2
MNLHFLNNEIQSSFFRDVRLIHDDLCSYAQSAAPYVAINEIVSVDSIREELNRDARFWNCILASLQVGTFVGLARLHDKAKNHNHFASYIKAMQSQNSECNTACRLLQVAIANQKTFIDTVVNLRHKLFAHTNYHAPLVAAFGFETLKILDFRNYWNEVLSAMEECDLAMFGNVPHAPKFEKCLFSSIEVATSTVLFRRQAHGSITSQT